VGVNTGEDEKNDKKEDPTGILLHILNCHLWEASILEIAETLDSIWGSGRLSGKGGIENGDRRAND